MTKLTRSFASIAAATLIALTLSAVVGAHAKLEKTNPADGVTITAPLEHLQLYFNSKVDVTISTIDLTGPTGKVALGDVHEMEANTLMAVVKGEMADGGYTVAWQTASADGHPAKGTFAFILKRSTH